MGGGVFEGHMLTAPTWPSFLEFRRCSVGLDWTGPPRESRGLPIKSRSALRPDQPQRITGVCYVVHDFLYAIYPEPLM